MSIEKPPDLKITQQSTTFTAQPQTDVEGQTAKISYRAPIQVGAQNGGAGAAISGVQGNIPGVIEYTAGVGDMANAARTACAACAHFDVRAWRQFVSAATGPASSAESRQTINTMRSRIMMAGFGYEDNNGEVDIERTLMAHGICRPLSDWVEGSVGRDPVFWPVVPWREATCPNTCHAGPHTLQVVTPAEPFGLYKPKDLEAKQIGANRYDNLLRAAQSVKLK
jgi:hypothetical protein